MLAFQFRLKLVTADSQFGISHGKEATIIVIDSGMSKCRLIRYYTKKRGYQKARMEHLTQLGCQIFQNTFHQYKNASVIIYLAAYELSLKFNQINSSTMLKSAL